MSATTVDQACRENTGDRSATTAAGVARIRHPCQMSFAQAGARRKQRVNKPQMKRKPPAQFRTGRRRQPLRKSDHPQQKQNNQDHQDQTDPTPTVVAHSRPHPVTAKTKNQQQNNQKYQHGVYLLFPSTSDAEDRPAAKTIRRDCLPPGTFAHAAHNWPDKHQPAQQACPAVPSRICTSSPPQRNTRASRYSKLLAHRRATTPKQRFPKRAAFKRSLSLYQRHRHHLR
jgi:hypothetical protein